MNTLEILVRAREIMASKKLCKGQIAVRPDGKPYYIDYNVDSISECCTFRAIIFASPSYHNASEMIERLIGKIRFTNGAAIGPWNDAPERTKEDVLALFDKAIAILEAQS